MNSILVESLIVFWSLVLLSSSALSKNDEFLYHGFKRATDNISLKGAAMIESNGILKLTNDTARLMGHAFYQKPIDFKNLSSGKVYSFSTAFAFVIVPEYEKLGGHGLAFAISPNKELEGALPSQYLGLLNASNNGYWSNHVLAVEFDTVQDFEFGDISDNHVGININNLVSNASVNAGYFLDDNSTRNDLSLQTGEVIQAWIDYDSAQNELNVTLSLSSTKPKLPVLSFHVDLAPIVKDKMYVGFSASTGVLASSHYLLGWSFKMNGKAQSLFLSSLPSLPRPKNRNSAFIISLSISLTIFFIFVIVISFYLIKKINNMDVIETWELNIGPQRFSYRELKEATKGFKDKELLGFGASGRVYKGILPNSKAQIAVKRISHESKQGLQEFATEISSIGRLRHKNLVQLIGWCRRRSDLLLVYDFMPNGSLDRYIFNEPKMILTWEQRFKIVKGVASGLLYLHEEWEQTVIHRDIKAGNVLLDLEMNSRLGDFGLSKLYEHGSNPSTTRVVGTLGYLAPELTKTGKPSTSSDVFAFGALLLEVVCGRKPIEPKALLEELYLVDWLWEKWKEGLILEVVDPRLRGEYDEIEVVLVLKLGLMCSNNFPANRPTMRQVEGYLVGEMALPEVLNPPDKYDGEKSRNNHGYNGGGGSSSKGFEIFEHFHPSPASFEERSTCSDINGDGKPDIEAGLVSSPSHS